MEFECIIDANQMTREELTAEYIRRMYVYQDAYLPDHSMKDLYSKGGFFRWINFSYIMNSVPSMPPASARISVCILTFNNASYIEQIIAAIRLLAFEVIVVDSGSTDGTEQIVRNVADRVLIVDNTLGFDQKRNAAIRAARGDWILMLDSDEAISESAFTLLRRYIAWANRNCVDVFWLPRYWITAPDSMPLRHYTGELCLWPDPQARLFRANADCQYTGYIHEKLSSAKDGKACFIQNELCSLFHFKYWLYSESTLMNLAKQRKDLQSDNLDLVQLLPWLYQKPTRSIPDSAQADNIRFLIDSLLKHCIVEQRKEQL